MVENGTHENWELGPKVVSMRLQQNTLWGPLGWWIMLHGLIGKRGILSCEVYISSGRAAGSEKKWQPPEVESVLWLAVEGCRILLAAPFVLELELFTESSILMHFHHYYRNEQTNWGINGEKSAGEGSNDPLISHIFKYSTCVLIG